ncbi:hypothetical protein [Methylovirgula sp. 4M-Z18]|uniref:hypothetical protein n=1 Tax=Methylovirgula sp. 4M-Z18 TaxID=2293567 RepID=UPI000E2FCE8F|nr:hypothetical protein [Methylovirgula sp. 4M-Z18]RFB79162.1 hypothetical protein DYH55_11270 [Methylovirgula sp. 4M-Z18]
MTAATFLVRARSLVGDADNWRDSAEKVLFWAQCSLRQPGVNWYNDQAFALVDRCFKIKEHTFDFMIRRDLDAIKVVYRQIADFYGTVKGGTEYLNVGPAIRPNDMAYANVGGWAKKDKTGLTFVLARCDNPPTDDETLTDIIMHESVHFAGGIDHFNIGGDPNNPAYGTKVFTLNNKQALKNASTYSYFAYLARMPNIQWATAT